MNYYIADTHFGCINKNDGRTLEHDQILIDNWNRTVTNADTVYVLGDIGRVGSNKDNEYLCKCISVLKGKKVCILGNHDDNLKDIRVRQLFTEVCDRKEVVDNFGGVSHKLVLYHYPELFWAGQHKGVIHLYGHLHVSNEWYVHQECLDKVNDYFKEQTLMGRTDCPQAFAYNIGACLPYMNYQPRTLKEIIAANS